MDIKSHRTRPSIGALGYNGEMQEPEGDWQILGNGYRVYNPVLLRFHSADDLSPFDEGGMNAYAYVGGEPINRTDSSGRFFQYVGIAAAFGGLAATAGWLASRTSGQGEGSDLFSKAAIGLAVVAGVAGGLYGLGRLGTTPSAPARGGVLGPHDPKMAFFPDRIAIQTHGAPFSTRVLDGDVFKGVDGGKLAKILNQTIGKEPSGKPVHFVSCYGAFGGKYASQAQRASNDTGRLFVAYPKMVYSDNHGGMSQQRSRLFLPQEGFAKWRTEKLNTALHRPADVALQVYLRIRGVRKPRVW